jgi:hypothetical protein
MEFFSMATIGNTFLNLIDMFRDKDAATATVIEMLAENCAAVNDAVTTPCNAGTVHKHAIRTGLPAVTWGQLYQGIPQSKSTKTMVQDATGFVEGLSSVDKRLLEISPDPAATRLSEANAFIESMTQEAEAGIFYHDAGATPEKFTGLAARYNKRSGGQASNQIVHGGGSGSDNTSVWMVTWGENQTTLLYPQGTKAGLTREDKGEQRVLDAGGNPYYVAEELFRWHLGLAVRDWRYNARIANIDVSELIAGNVDLYALMRSAYHKLHSVRATSDMRDPNAARSGRTVIYCNATVYEALDALQTNGTLNTALRLTPMELEGKEVMTYRGIPIRRTDALLNSEAVVQA